MLKKAIIILVIVGVLAGLYWASQRSDTDVVIDPDQDEEEVQAFRPNPSNATFTFDDGPITLSRGRHENAVMPGSALVEETILTDQIAFGDLNDDGRDDAAVILVRQGGGSGYFVYVATFVSGSGAYRGSNAVFIGDRINPESISVADGVITVNYLDRDPSEPLAADPTVRTSSQYVFLEGELQER